MRVEEHPEWMRKEGDEPNALCPHGRISGAYCEPCAEVKANDMWENMERWSAKPQLSPITGMNASYYDWPNTIKCAQDLIEYLELDFNQGNILKSLVRSNGPSKKKTTSEYEAEKRYYYAEGDLRRVQKNRGAGAGRLPDAEKGLETTTETG